MREILFKAKRLDNGEWVEGYYLNIAKINPFICTEKIKLNGALKGIMAPEMYETDPDTLCQYIGLTDKHGWKIWENDIVKHEDSQSVGTVKWYCNDYIGWCVDDVYNGEQQFTKEMWGECEIVGNIFDNPELLEVEDDGEV